LLDFIKKYNNDYYHSVFKLLKDYSDQHSIVIDINHINDNGNNAFLMETQQSSIKVSSVKIL